MVEEKVIITINNDKFNDGTSSNCINDEQICRLATTVHCNGGPHWGVSLC